MSKEVSVVVIGGGAAGVSAAISIARTNVRVLLVEQRDRLGGAIHRQPASKSTPPVTRAKGHVQAWAGLMKELLSCRERITVATSTIFSGIDGNGFVLLDNRHSGELVAVRPEGMVLALGATEVVHPFPGWELPGVFSAGGVQVLLKETGCPLKGTTLLAGSGPLLLALGAQLCAAGGPPLAILERGEPFKRPTASLKLLSSLPRLFEGAGYMVRLASANVPYRSGAQIVSAKSDKRGFLVEVLQRGQHSTYQVDNLVVHDGLRAGHLAVDLSGLPFPTVEAGDGREILGAHCAMADGRLAAAKLLSRLGIATTSAAADEQTVRAARRFQSQLRVLFYKPPPPIQSETVVCRCEGRRASNLPKGVTAREAKLVGRFGMGACQGRFCADATARALGEGASFSEFRPAVMRWPIRPLAAASIARLRFVSANFNEIWNDDTTFA
jgi:D-hydroxyproline dehydrogenase subunit alpha